MLTEFLAQPTKYNLNMLLLIFLAATAAMLFQQWSTKRAVGLPIAYCFSFAMLHAIGAFIYGLPNYTPKADILLQNNSSLLNTFTGFRVALFGYVAFVLAVLVSGFIFRKDPKRVLFVAEPQITTKLPGTLILFSIVSFFFLGPLFRRIPSLGSMATAGTAISIVGLFLFCWLAWQQGDKRKFMIGLVGTCIFPFVTILTMGFAGYGAIAASFVWMFVIRFFRPRWLSLTILGVIIFASLTFYVNWMAERESIRAAVWGQRSLEHRIEKAMNLVENFEMLNFKKQLHLEIIDIRLNQNDLVGKAVLYVQRGRVDFAHGYTLWIAAISWVPRILWPGKPKTGGSGDVVAHFTGQVFAQGTSVGAGQPLEFYVNFGWPGVFVCFMLLGFLLCWIDRHVAFYLAHGDMWTATRWLLPGLGLINPGGLMTELIGSLAAFSVFATALHYFFFKKYYDNQGPQSSQPQAAPKPIARRRYS